MLKDTEKKLLHLKLTLFPSSMVRAAISTATPRFYLSFRSWDVEDRPERRKPGFPVGRIGSHVSLTEHQKLTYLGCRLEAGLEAAILTVAMPPFPY